MILFWVLGAALAAAALALVMRALLSGRARGRPTASEVNISIRRDQLRELDADLAAGKLAREDHERSRKELEARLLEDLAAPAEGAAQRPGRRLALAIGAAIPVAAVALYFVIGTPGAIAPEAEHALRAQQIEAMVARLAARMRENPDDGDGWKLLGRSYAVLGRYGCARLAPLDRGTGCRSGATSGSGPANWFM